METVFFILKSMVLGIVEGVTEFLPVSSTGHLIIFQSFLGFDVGQSKEYIDMYTYVIQLGAILAVIVLFWKKIMNTLVKLFPSEKRDISYRESGLRFWLIIVAACIPGAIVQLGFGDFFDEYLMNPTAVSIALVVGGILMILIENKYRKRRNGTKSELDVTIKQALIIGAFQCLAVFPGMSRSASTIMGGWIAGLTTIAAAEFSFFLAIPVMAGMSLLKIVKIGGFAAMTSAQVISLGVGFLVAFIVALIVVDRFIAFLKKKPMRIFAVYRFVFAVFVFIAGYLGFFNV
ncbi:undecaprenyl-diphosphate phosphatase [Clostridium cellulovorans]|uniref:Undecaprenyl-diphosphatase n=1 Tax=Clostridium cellulovorans (strain ATCC 35296 / DSM 3052 / OCM 3 / 743B) TaxID=573061 RepID=D9SST6_CLOC7|nr:undecaprenyl-diphosphate phosphatase [Clostridium cellulovorans]ADL52598.1 undecaprenol kinase [Clostridium cellulovorans 743B]